MNKITGLSVGVLLAGLILIGWSPTPASAAPGARTANFLKVDAGARAAALAGNQFGADQDTFAQFYNPAFLGNLSQKEIGFMHNRYFQDLSQELFTFGRPTLSRGNFAAAFNYFTYGGISGYAPDGSPAGDVSANDLMVNVGWGKLWPSLFGGDKFKDLSLGASAKFIRKTLSDTSGTAFAFDFGFVYPLKSEYLKGMDLALSYQNLGTALQFGGESQNLPQTLRVGAGYGLWGKAIMLMADGVFPSNDSPYVAAGIEYKMMKMFAVRFGYKGDKDLDKNFTYGVGFENPIFRLDYAFVPFGDLGDSHRVSAVFRFGRSVRQSVADVQLKQKIEEAKALYAQGQLVDAYMAAIQIQQIAPWLTDNTRLLSRIQKDFRELEESDRKEKLLLQVQALFEKGEKFFEEGNFLNAQLEFQAVLGLQPNHKAAQGYLRQIQGQFQAFVQSFYQNGLKALEAHDFEKAKEEFEKVLVIKPDHTQAKVQLAKCVDILEGRQKEAAEARQKDAFEKARQSALRAYENENFEEAILLYGEVLRIDKKNDDAKAHIASSREALFKRALTKGQELASRGQWESAIKNLKEAMDYNQDSREARSALQDVYRKWDLQKKVVSQNLYKEGLEAFLGGDKKKAKAAWEKALDLDPDNQEAKRGLARLGQ